MERTAFRRVRVAIAAAALAFTTVAAGAETAPVTLQLGLTAPIPLNAASNIARFRLPVTLPPGMDPGSLIVKRLAVLHDKQPPADGGPQFTVDPKLVSAVANSVPSLAVDVSGLAKLAPGTYELTVAVTAPGAIRIQPLTLSFERRYSQLQPPGKQVIDIRGGSWWSDELSAPSQLRIPVGDEARTAALYAVRAVDGPYKGPDGIQVPATLAPTVADAVAGAPLQVVIKPMGFPVGLSQGRMEISSPDLKTPLTFDIEVQRRRHIAWIALMVLAGIATGAIVRVLLQRRVELARARATGVEALDSLRKWHAKYGDPKYREALAAPVAALEAAIGGTDPAAVTRALAAANDAARVALEALRTDLSSIAEQLAQVHSVARTDPPLPESFRAPLEALAAAADSAANAVKQHDATSAREALDQALAAAARNLHEAGMDAAARLPQVNAQLLRLQRLLDPTSAAARSDAWSPFSPAQESKLAASRISAMTASGIGEYLEAWRQYGRTRVAALSSLAVFLQADAGTLAELAIAKLPSPKSVQPAVDNWHGAVAALARALAHGAKQRSAFDMPPLDIEEAQKAERELVHAVRGARKLEPEKLQASDEHAAAARYFEALRAMPAPEEGEQVLGARPPATPASSPVPGLESTDWLARAPHPRSLPHAAAVVLRVPELGVLDDLQGYRERNLRQLAWASGLQAGIVAAIIGTVSFLLFQDRFVGTPSELASLFLWGFSTDVSAAKLVELSTAWAAKPKAAG